MLSLQNLIIVAPPPPDPNWHFNAQARKRVMQIKTQANSRGWTRSLVRGGGDFPSSNDIMHTIKVGWERAAFRRSKVFFYSRLKLRFSVFEATKPLYVCDY